MCLLFLIEWSNRIQSKCDECWKKENASFLSLLFFCVVPGARSLVLRLVLVSPKSHSCIHFFFLHFLFFRILRSYSTKPSFVVLFSYSYTAILSPLPTLLEILKKWWSWWWPTGCSECAVLLISFFFLVCVNTVVLWISGKCFLYTSFFFLISGGVWMFKEKGI